AYRTVRANLSFSDIDNELKTILFTSTKQNEGKSTTTCNIAHSFSQLENKKVLLLDLDLRNPTVHKLFAKSNTYGVIDFLKGNVGLDKCIHKEGENLYILPTGTIPPNPTEVLSSKKMSDFVKSVKEEYDYILIDAPPVGIVSDASIIASFVDGVMFVIESDVTDISHAEIAIENLNKVGANILGAILNKFDSSKTNYGYYGYYYEEQESGSRKNKRGKRGKKKKF
ncbi:MAG: CpsD/CapB family tyrosine-protein kinase, partial [Peptostreptococcaceae bacterium]